MESSVDTIPTTLFPFYGNSARRDCPTFWTCLRRECRLRAALEGYPDLYLDEEGTNAASSCKICGRALYQGPVK